MIALRPIHNQAVEEGDVDDGSRDLLIFAGREIDMWMLALGQVRRECFTHFAISMSCPGSLMFMNRHILRGAGAEGDQSLLESGYSEAVLARGASRLKGG